jgi:hypothetical protein
MPNKNLLLLFLLLVCWNAHAQQQQDQRDTVMKEQPVKRKAQIRSTARLHSKGMFAYGGRVCSDDPAFDINFVYDRKTWGFFVFKAVDLVDQQSPNNFTLAVAYKNFKITKQLNFTPHVGAFLEQQHQFAGHGSDVALIGVTAFKFNPHFTLDHTMLFGNFVVESEMRDWVNRFRLLYTSRHLDITGIVWHNNHVFDDGDYASAAITLAYNRIKLSDSFNLNFAVTDIMMARSSNEESVPTCNKFVVMTALQFVR